MPLSKVSLSQERDRAGDYSNTQILVILVNRRS